MAVAFRIPRSYGFAFFFLLSISYAYAEPPAALMRISLENQESHVQVRMVRLFADRLSSARGGRIAVEVYDQARLFRDSDVVPALAMGKVEMAVPGIWQLDRYEPDFASLMLPSVYGVPEPELSRAVDGAFGAFLSEELESALPVVVVGRWMELGAAHTFFIGRNPRALRALRVRVAGGVANEERLRALGASPLIVPWLDLSAFIARGGIDAVVTTYETILSASLHKNGVGSVSEDGQYVGYYVPLVSRRFWESLGAEARDALSAAWEATIDEARTAARDAQARAKATLRDEGLRITVPPAEEVMARRELLLSHEDYIASKIYVSPKALGLLREALGSRRR